jgi:hypothetical protein
MARALLDLLEEGLEVCVAPERRKMPARVVRMRTMGGLCLGRRHASKARGNACECEKANAVFEAARSVHHEWSCLLKASGSS